MKQIPLKLLVSGLWLFLVLSSSHLSWAQPSYEVFKSQYEPHNEYLGKTEVAAIMMDALPPSKIAGFLSGYWNAKKIPK